MLRLTLDVVKILSTAIYGLTAYFLRKLISTRKIKCLKQDVALITGAGMGLGYQMAIDLSRHCHKLILADINIDKLETLKEDLKRVNSTMEIYPIKCDVTKISDIDALVKFAHEKFGRVTLLISNAGIVKGKYLLSQTDQDFEKVIQVNLVSHFYLVRRLLPDMLGKDLLKYPGLADEIGQRKSDLEPRGHIVMVNSIAGHFPTPGLGEYNASKAGAVMFCESLRNELRIGKLEKSIKTTNVMPYFINTGMFDGVDVRKLNSILPINSVEESSKRIIEGILYEEADIFIPKRLCLIPFFQSFLPSPVMDRIKDVIDISRLMLQFKGR